MPTGYTAAIANGISFRQFAMSCARNFGALISMRDEPSCAEIPEKFEPSPYYAEHLHAATEELKRVEAMSAEELDAAADTEYQKDTEERRKQIAKTLALRGQYQSMLSKVRAWVPPSEDHAGLRSFMIEQIEGSIEFDCSTDYYEKRPIKYKTGKAWRDERIQAITKDITYYTKELQKENARVEGRNDWIKKLRNSLPED